MLESLPRILRPLRQDPDRQRLGGLEEDLVVEQIQGLQRRVGPAPAADGLVTARHVEVGQERIGEHALVLDIETAAIAVLPLARHPLPPLHLAPRLGRTNALASHGGIQQAAHGQSRIADQLRRQPRPRLARQQDVVRVPGLQFRPDCG